MAGMTQEQIIARIFRAGAIERVGIAMVEAAKKAAEDAGVRYDGTNGVYS